MSEREPLTAETVDARLVAKTLDHSVLRPDMTPADIDEGIRVAAEYDVASLCCRPIDVARAAAALGGTDVPVCTVIGFPHGSVLTSTKVAEAVAALEQGATELDMVLQIGMLRAGLLGEVEADIAAVVAAAAGAAVVKVIMETALLTDAQKVAACRVSEAAGAGYVKTSTGFAASGANLHDVRLLRATVSPAVKVKASGGIRTLDDVVAYIDAGAARCGTSAADAILDDLARRQQR